MVTPFVGIDGVRQTINANATPTQRLWNLRSALNVAALNCQSFEHEGLVDNYGAILTTHQAELAATNRTLAGEYRERYGAEYLDRQDAFMTRVYNYFALPPVQKQFCDVALQVSNELLIVPPGELADAASPALDRLEAVFTGFYDDYDRYRIDLAAWDRQYGPPVPSYGTEADAGFADAFAAPAQPYTAPEQLYAADPFATEPPVIATQPPASNAAAPSIAADPSFGDLTAQPAPEPSIPADWPEAYVSDPPAEPGTLPQWPVIDPSPPQPETQSGQSPVFVAEPVIQQRIEEDGDDE